MQTTMKTAPFTKKTKELLSELMEKEGIDEMGLLDLVFIEEILNQKKDQGKKA
jgi:hypothetical protein